MKSQQRPPTAIFQRPIPGSFQFSHHYIISGLILTLLILTISCALTNIRNRFSFNQLCLPDYESMEAMHKALLVAINEGTQGFGLI